MWLGLASEFSGWFAGRLLSLFRELPVVDAGEVEAEDRGNLHRGGV